MSIYHPAIMAVSLLGSTFVQASPAQQGGSAVIRSSAGTVLTDVQNRIAAARLQAVKADNSAALEEIAAQLRGGNTGGSNQTAYYVSYWLAYTDYLIANRQLKAGRRTEAASLLNEASTLLTSIPTPDVESQTLLSLVAGLRIAVSTPATIGESIGQARDALERAIALNPNNVRVLYARALADYTTPKQYGGGRVAERFARSAIERASESPRGLKPAWGRDDSAALLVRILRANGRDAEATALLARSMAQYPSSASLLQVSDVSK